MSNVKYSIVVAAYNEEEVLPFFFDKIIPMFEGLNESFELIMVNDGSRDKTAEIIEQKCKEDKRVIGINLSRNFGQQAALLCGLKESRGDAIIVMDADLQDPPEIALQMIDKWKEGFDIIHGRRKKRPGESVFKRLTAKIYYKFLNRITNPKAPQNVGDFKLYSRRAIDVILSMPERNRYLKTQASWIGFKQAFIEFDRPAREVGETKYTVKKLVKLALDGIISNSNYPLTLSAKIGTALCVASLITFITFVIVGFLVKWLPLTAWLFPTVGMLFGIDLVVKGFSDIYLSKVYEEVKNRPIYIVKDKFNGHEDD